MNIRQSESEQTAAPDVVVIGATCLDIKGHAAPGGRVGTSNPGNVRISAGGCARNIAENLARLGTRVALLSVVCQDDFGLALLRQTERAGVNTDHVLISCDQHSASYIALLDGHGKLIYGIDDTTAVAGLTPEYIETHADLLRSARMVMLDANVALQSAEVVLRICDAAGVPVGLDPVAVAPAQRYQELAGRFALLTPNALEAEALTGQAVHTASDGVRAAKWLVAHGTQVAVITLAGAGVAFATGDVSGHVPALDVEIVDETGASDALTATLIYGTLNGLATDEAVRLGVSAAMLTLQTTETVRQDLNLESLYAQLVI